VETSQATMIKILVVMPGIFTFPERFKGLGHIGLTSMPHDQSFHFINMRQR
jgi:hypothetical protein